jgi:DNA-binding phage protein
MHFKSTCGKFIIMEDIVVTVWRLIKETSSVRRVSMELGMDRASLYRSLKKGTNPRIDTIMKFLTHLGYRLQVVKAKRRTKKPMRSKRVESRR